MEPEQKAESHDAPEVIPGPLPNRFAGGAIAGLPATLEWDADSESLLLLDQTRLPAVVEYRRCRTAQHVWQAIRELCVRGAPAIGVAAAYGLCLGTRSARGGDLAAFHRCVEQTAAYLDASRPTAVNLAWALGRMRDSLRCAAPPTAAAAWAHLLREARSIEAEDAETCRRIGAHGAGLVSEGRGVLTHCNAGSLATVAFGTALAPLYAAHEAGRRFRVFADETRPLLQGARLTAFELAAAGLDVTVLCDGAAAGLLASGLVGLVIVGADRIAANGDTANKVGTFGVALAAARHGIPFYVAAPRSTIDLSVARGAEIPIEERAGEEIVGGYLRPGVAVSGRAYNPAFDVTPADLIRGIVTECGIISPVNPQNIREIFGTRPLQRG